MQGEFENFASNVLRSALASACPLTRGWRVAELIVRIGQGGWSAGKNTAEWGKAVRIWLEFVIFSNHRL